MNPLKHVAIIMDGNGRWGLKNYNSRNRGHREGLNTLENIIKVTIKKNIPYLTIFAFSTENWKRPISEINYLLNLLEVFLEKKINEFNKNNIKLNVIGEKKFSNKINKLLIKSEKLTKNNSKLQINLAINYGSKQEIIKAVQYIHTKKLKLNEKNISQFLYTRNIPDPDVLIRTGNTKRLSNFLLWQLSYTEIFFSKKLWPEFTEKDYVNIINRYRLIKRNFGKI